MPSCRFTRHYAIDGHGDATLIITRCYAAADAIADAAIDTLIYAMPAIAAAMRCFFAILLPLHYALRRQQSPHTPPRCFC